MTLKISRTILAIFFIPVISIIFVIYFKINTPNRPNVIIVVSDALRKDHLGCYGYPRDTSPHIDAFAKTATLFKNAFAQAPHTKPSIASLFTSRYPSQHNTKYHEEFLSSTLVTLAEVLSERNYRTAGFVENIAVFKPGNYSQGFSDWAVRESWPRIREHGKGNDNSTEEFDNKIFSWLEKNHDDPFFLYLHYIDPHFPYNAPKPFNGLFNDSRQDSEEGTDLAHRIASYDEEIRFMDFRFGKLVEKLEQLNILDKSIIIFTSDHGEGFLEHGRFGHGNSVYAELINIPLIIRYPKLFRKGYGERYVQHIDIFPTIVHALKIDTGSFLLEGKSILSKSDKDVKVFSEQLRKGKRRWLPQRSIIFRGWKLIHNLPPDTHNTHNLFNVREDPLDYENVAGEHPEIVADMRSHISHTLRVFSGYILIIQGVFSKMKQAIGV